MNSVERFFTALNRREPDRVPIMELEIAPKVINAVLPGGTLLDFVEKMDLDAVMVSEDIPWEDVRPGVKRDHFGILRQFNPASMMGLDWPVALCPPITSEKELDSYVPPDPYDERRLVSLRKAVERFKGEKVTVFAHHSSFLYPMLMLGFENLLLYYYEKPVLAKQVTDMVVDYFVKLQTCAIEIGADVILDGEDYCGNTGLFMSPAHFDEFCLPGLQRVVTNAKERNIPFIKHSDGNIWAIIDRLVETGIDGLNPIEPAAGMDIGEVKKAYGDRIALVGNIDCARLLPFGTPDEVRRVVKQTIQTASPGGGHIMCSSNVIHDQIPPENYVAMIEATKEFGQYPIRVAD